MRVTIDPEELAPIIAATVAETIARIRDEESKLGDRLAVSEPEGARLLTRYLTDYPTSVYYSQPMGSIREFNDCFDAAVNRYIAQ